jgi:hypothetical protein
MTEFDPTKFIDREFEQELFADMLEFGDEARVLSIHDVGGMGKSHLLEHFQYRCRTNRPDRTPVSLISLDDAAIRTPLSLVRTIRKHLGDSFRVPFPNFQRHHGALTSGDFMSIRSMIDARWSNFKSAASVSIKGTEMHMGDVREMHLGGAPRLTPEQEKVGQDACIVAFFDDLKAYCADRPVVLLLDAYEHCEPALQRWIEDYLLQRHFFDVGNRPAYLIVVVAGRSVPKFDRCWATEECEAIVRSVDKLDRWNRAHIEECLRVHGLHYQPKHVDTFYNLIEMDIPPSQIVQMIQTAVRKQRQQL